MQLLEGIKQRLENKNARMALIVILGLAAMLLLLLSECSERSDTGAALDKKYDDTEIYRSALEIELTELVGSIDGAGKALVMITLQGSYEYIYATEEKTSSETRTNEEQRVESESEYIIIKAENGEEALLKTRINPQIAGVVIICEGADDPVVHSRIILAVTTALDISSKRVCVILSTKDLEARK